jgi:hypothetical protein
VRASSTGSERSLTTTSSGKLGPVCSLHTSSASASASVEAPSTRIATRVDERAGRGARWINASDAAAKASAATGT